VPIEVERVDAGLDDQVRQVTDRYVSVPQVNGGLPVEFRPGFHDGDLKLMFHGADGVARLVELRVDEVRAALDLVEVMD
jgi:hypothetical protein